MTASPHSILVIDDYPDTMQLVRFLLLRLGYAVTTASSGADALAADAQARAQGKSFSLYIVDDRLPDGCGLDLREQLRLANPGARALFYTGTAYTGEQQHTLRHQGDDYLLKPVEPAHFYDAVARLLDTT